MDELKLAHTKANCKYHIVFTPKYRRQIIYGQLKREIGAILRTLCDRKGIRIIEASCCKDHIHMYVEIPPKYSVSSVVGYLKGKSSLIIFDRCKYRLHLAICTDFFCHLSGEIQPPYRSCFPLVG